MLGDASCRILLYILGYIVPAYACFKALEQKNLDKIRGWCIYWLLLALFTTAERIVLDWLVFWVPLYYEAKVLFVVYMWHSKTQGALHLYTAYVQPFLRGHEAAVDQYLQEGKMYISDFCAANFQQFATLLQTKIKLAISALQYAQSAEMEEVQEEASAKSGAKFGAKSKLRASSLKAMSLEDELPPVPTRKIE